MPDAVPENGQPSEEKTSTGRPDPILRIGVLAGLLSAGWLMLSPFLGHMDRPWPCVAFGVVMLAGVTMAFRRPAQRIGWGLVIVICGSLALLLGAGAIVPGLIGLSAGGLIVMSGSEKDSTKSG